jgi:coenzyme Q-binding protein COQ10
MVSASPLTRSSHHAGDDFARLKGRSRSENPRRLTGRAECRNFRTSTPVPTARSKMFDLVADVERYPEFLPMCEALKIKDRRERDDMTMLIADMTVGYKMIRETFTSQVLLKPEENAIDVSYVDGPFRYLDNKWRFEPRHDGGCDVVFLSITSSRAVRSALLMGAMFDKAFHMFSQAFQKRARGSPEPCKSNNCIISAQTKL